jgi:glycine/D-amino acid oxidase-like deaminating enzyme
MESSSPYDVIIVGNGVIGYSIAYELAKRSGDLRIGVFGPAHRSGAASAAAGAMLNTFGEITRHTLNSVPGQAKFDLTRKALDRWPSWLAELKEASGDPDLDRTYTMGTTVILNTKCGMLDNLNFAALEAALAKFDEPHEYIDPQDVVGLLPRPDGRPLRALHLSREGAIDARAWLRGLEAATRATGVTSVDAQVTEIRTEAGRSTGVTLADGTTVDAGTVVLAAGAFSGPLTRVFEPGTVPAMYAGRGIAFMTRRTDEPGFRNVVRTPTRAGNCGLHMVPFGDGREYYGATNIPTDEPKTLGDLGMSEFLLRVAREQLDQRLYFADVEWKIGNRPMSIDGFPMIGRTSIDGLLVATGTYRDGFHCSPVIARLVVDDLLGAGTLADALPHFRPERAPIQTMTPEEAVQELIATAVAGAYEDSAILPGYHIGVEPFDAHYERAMDRFYAVLDTPVALLPEILLSLIFEPDLAGHRVVSYLNAAQRRYGTAS